MGKKWEGGDMNRTGGGHKVNLLKKELKVHADDKDKIVLFTDGYVFSFFLQFSIDIVLL